MEARAANLAKEGWEAVSPWQVLFAHDAAGSVPGLLVRLAGRLVTGFFPHDASLMVTVVQEQNR